MDPEETVVELGKTCRYKTAHCIGRGSFGNVYNATVTDRGDYIGENKVAVKIIQLDKEEHWDDKEMYNRMHGRLKSLLDLDTEHLVGYFKIKIITPHTGRLFSVELVMEFCSGGDLGNRMKKLHQAGNCLAYSVVKHYAKDIADGLSYLHKKAIIHGDLKPGNVLIRTLQGGDERLVLCDMDDLVQMQDRSTCSRDLTHLRGTIRYMAPELLHTFVSLNANGAKQNSPGRKTDIWSLGCIILKLSYFISNRHDECLYKGTTIIVADDNEMNDNRYMTLVAEGYAPLIPVLTHPILATCIERCLRIESEDRISADQVQALLSKIENLHYKEIVLLLHQKTVGRNVGYSNTTSYVNYHHAQTFDPSTNTIRIFPLPAKFVENQQQLKFTAFNSSAMLCQAERIGRSGNLQNARFFETVVWDVAEQTYHPVPHFLPDRRINHAVTVNNKIYFTDKNDHLLHIADLLTPSTIISVDVPKKIFRILNGVQLADKIIYIGMPSNGTVVNAMFVECFDTVTGEWSSLPVLPGSRVQFAMLAFNNDIYIFGGCSPQGSVKTCWRLRMSTETWETMGPLLEDRRDACAFALDQRIYDYQQQTHRWIHGSKKWLHGHL
ncbi:uncharacterized protein LOC129589827 [Paramacrobiotus metropolitanus]|uniref:uncharacterized protein LOC129589827 n=1 Tax=Paramacrobiotus metropolitanus TaxID=2943436 RepID=UPI0024459353|nr:uncharacterized protein LOC129589827 [Paramacrobiotus metropolitanus]